MPRIDDADNFEGMVSRRRPELIAEVGSVHDGSLGNALRLIDLAKDVGADTVKFQMHVAEAETTRSAPAPSFFQAESRYEYFARTAFNEAEWLRLKTHAEEVGIGFLVSPFSEIAAERLISMGVTRIKVASGELDNRPLLELLSAYSVDVVLSVGMSLQSEIVKAVGALSGASSILVMQCASLYPCSVELSGVAYIPKMIEIFGPAVGYSDHTVTNTAALVAASMGAVAIEKHLTFSRAMYGSDAPYASEPNQFRELAAGLGEVARIVEPHHTRDEVVELHCGEARRIFRHGLVASRPLTAGTTLTSKDVASKKPADGIQAWDIHDAVGRRLNRDLEMDEPVRWSDLEDG